MPKQSQTSKHTQIQKGFLTSKPDKAQDPGVKMNITSPKPVTQKTGNNSMVSTHAKAQNNLESSTSNTSKK